MIVKVEYSIGFENQNLLFLAWVGWIMLKKKHEFFHNFSYFKPKNYLGLTNHLSIIFLPKDVSAMECPSGSPCSIRQSMTCFIYILDSSNSSSFTFWYSQLASSSRSNWTGIWTGNSNGTWTDKQSSHFSTAKEIIVKATFFFM